LLARRHRGQPETVTKIAWQAQHRLHKRYCNLMARDKTKQKVITAIGRELLGFVWAIAVEIEGQNPFMTVKRAA
jgi:transposase